MDELQRYKATEIDHSVYVSTTEMVVRYRPHAELERWVKYRMSEKSDKKNKYMLWIIGAFFVLGGPVFVAQMMRLLLQLMASGSTNAAAAAAETIASTYAVISYFYLFIGTAIGTSALVYLLAPTHLSVGSEGARLIWFRKVKGLPGGFTYRGKLIPWSSISRAVVEKPMGKPSPNDQLLTLQGGTKSLLKLRLGAFWTMEDRSHVLEAIERWAPGLPRDAEVIGALEAPADYSYTELWMKALSAPPKRERLKPLAEHSYLRDGKYHVGNALGVGGQGTAYLAYDVGADNRSVVLKEFILPVYVDIAVRKQALDKFEREAKILKQLDHPQVVKLIDFFVEDHRGYLVLEHIDGQSLRQKVDGEGKLSESVVRQLAMQMCEILSYLHGLSPPVVHRDFTPDNLILRKDGTLKLVDFNVAQQTDSTATGTVVGKHAYLPPEQFRGQPTTQSDIYAMGATLYYLLVGEDPEPISMVFPREAEASVSEQLDAIVAKATAIEPQRRYQKSEDILSDLAQTAEPSARTAT